METEDNNMQYTNMHVLYTNVLFRLEVQILNLHVTSLDVIKRKPSNESLLVFNVTLIQSAF